MGERRPRHDAERARQLGVPFHDADLVAGNDKFLAAGNKPATAHRTYKARLFNREPEFAPMELTIRIRGRTHDQTSMEQQRKTIAVIDDNPAIRQAIERMLNIAGFRVRQFASAGEFLAGIATCDVGCAVIDIDLGLGSCGIELAGHPVVAAARLPFIFISGTADEGVRRRAIALGCIEYLRKPFMPIELLDAVFRATQEPPIP
ncbi:MAG TPA: response regulator [Steroidobacteraceae bacterium]|nr:response regulator [Steroidobacteraceae bacterium]